MKLNIHKKQIQNMYEEVASNYDLRFNFNNNPWISYVSTVEEYEILHQIKREYNYIEIAIDIGSGTGRITEKISMISQSVIAIDISLNMIKFSLKNLESYNNVYFVCADIEYLPLRKNIIDLVVCAGIISHLNSPQKVINKFLEPMKKGGKIVISDMNPLSIHRIIIWMVQKFVGKSFKINESFTYVNTWRLKKYMEYNGFSNVYSKTVGLRLPIPLVRLHKKNIRRVMRLIHLIEISINKLFNIRSIGSMIVISATK